MNNNKPLFIASFMTLIAAGVGFAIRGGILADWGAQYGFTKLELGTITGGGLVGFGIVILLASLITDNVGYKPILLLAFILHVLSALVTFAATPIFESVGKDGTYWCLYVGMFMFAVANGLCEAVINPLVATLYPKQKTHYLNILHAGWPGGLIIGGIIAAIYGNLKGTIPGLRWEIPMAVFLIPTLIYGFIVIKEKFPLSEAKSAGVSYGQMLMTFASPLLIFLLFLHACVGYVELGTDSWIASITDSILTGQGLILFVYASLIMFVLRFFAGPIVERINPLGLLCVSACFGAVGLYMIGSFEAAYMIWIAVTVYGLGKTFLWPTMLGVVGERFPQGGAITMGAMGGIGMLSAGLLGGPGIGYNQDYYATKDLEKLSPQAYERYSVAEKSGFLFLPKIKGLDGAKVSVLNNDGKDLEETVTQLKKEGKPDKNITALNEWWQGAKKYASEDKGPVDEAGIYGGRMALKCTALVPLIMAIGYFILVLYFRSKGGYQVEVLHGEEPIGEHYTGGIEGPIE
ncbi:MFS transporter [Gimesia aquarii]|uniref:Major Facilitator Superfamily protein n=1 Tax=Gimesia aquarii TaxID=2527964 RepID=A0A517VZP3_9PLAN|nr:MFS transporter [Gimesia aquarii]QDT98469.1 Major Facilitator Superfamily protein [Gimesia aquarii]